MHQMKFRSVLLAALFALVLAIAPPAPCQAQTQYTLSESFDGGALDVEATTIDGDVIHLAPRATWTIHRYASRYRWVSFRISGVEGRTPEFRVTASDFLGSLRGHRFLYRENPTDPESEWRFFDRGDVDRDNDLYTFTNDRPFTADEVEVAWSVTYPVSRASSLVEELNRTRFVSPTPSSDQRLIVGKSLGGKDEFGREIPQLPLYGFRLADDEGPAEGTERQTIVLISGVHSSETVGNHALEGFLKFLVSDEPEAARLRSIAEFFVYPLVDPDGRYGGRFRNSHEAPTEDMNRHWHQPETFTNLRKIRQAILTDTGGHADILFDFHGISNQGNDFVFTLEAFAETPFMQALEARTGIGPRPSEGHPGMARIYFARDDRLGLREAYTPEFAPRSGRTSEELQAIGRQYALALLDALLEHQRGDREEAEAEAETISSY
ncbi:MAG: succinylglutamate desuccinylase/aspartoacylase family protein [Phycisphaerales bacterium]|nr:succinylglutamate desuccinylase/aspartoacylase family protein [Phycisphaerales bacterium]